MVAYTFRQPAGIPGSISRNENLTVEPQAVDATAAATAPLNFGYPVKTSAAGLMQALVSGDAASLITGWVVRSYPGGANALAQGLGQGIAPVSGMINRMKRGYMQILLQGAAAAVKDAPVYIRTLVAASGRLVGALEAAADTSATSAAKGGGNTGNGTLTALTATGSVPAGVTQVRMTSATAFTVTGPNGQAYPAGVNGAYSQGGLAFTVTAGGTPFIAGDGFDITVAQNTQVIPGAFFVGPADASGNTEIAYNI